MWVVRYFNVIDTDEHEDYEFASRWDAIKHVNDEWVCGWESVLIFEK